MEEEIAPELEGKLITGFLTSSLFLLVGSCVTIGRNENFMF